MKKWVLITGASSGIGYAAARHLSGNGFGVYACARQKHDLEQLGRFADVVPLKLDVTKNNEIDDCFKTIKERGRGLFGLVNNAGIDIDGPLMAVSQQGLQRQFDVNLMGVHKVTKRFFPLLLKAGGRIIMISSLFGRVAFPFSGPYCTSKFALEGYSDCLRRELLLINKAMKVVIIEPGIIKTPIWQKKAEITIKKEDKKTAELWNGLKKELGDDIYAGRVKSIQAARVAKGIHHSLIKKSPKTRYMISENNLYYFVMNILPDSRMDKFVKNYHFS